MRSKFLKNLEITLAVVFMVLPAASNAAGSVLISEVMYDLTGSDTNREWIEIYNSSSDPVTIIDGSGDSSWRFNDGANHTLTLIQGSLTLPSGGVAILVSSSTAFFLDHPNFSGTVIDTVMSLGNTSETLKISNDKGITFFTELTYQNTWGGTGDGKSLEKVNLNGVDDGTNWRSSNADGGTPGLVNNQSVSSPIFGLAPSSSSGSGSGSGVSYGTSTPMVSLKAVAGLDVIAEVGQVIKFNASKSEGANSYKWYLGDGNIKEGIEVDYSYNFSGTYLVTLEVSNGNEISLDQVKVLVFGGKALINEVFFSNSSTTPSWIEIFNPTKITLDISGWLLENQDKKFIFPPFSIIPAGGYFIVSDQVSNLGVKTGSIKLKYPNDLVMDEVVFEKIQLGFSASRTSDGFSWTKEITPGGINIVTSSGTALLESMKAIPNLVKQKEQNIVTRNYLASFYNQVEAANTTNNQKTEEENSFWNKLGGGLLFWLVVVIVVCLIFGIGYIRLIRKNQ